MSPARLAIVCAAAGLSSVASADLVITEIQSKSLFDTEDFIEITNFGNAAVDITNWSFDDESAAFIESSLLQGIISIGAGETVIILQPNETDENEPAFNPAGEIAAFRDYWGGLEGVQIGYHLGAGLGRGDAAYFFNAMGEVALFLEYGDGENVDPDELIDDTHTGEWVGASENDSAIWIPGSDNMFTSPVGGVFGSFQNGDGNWGSPGVVPTPGAAALLGLAGLAGVRRRR
jgi:MYXO-CTERM domain-containing protein